MSAPSRTAHIRALAVNDPTLAEQPLTALLNDLFGIEARNVRINLDQYSLNSLNGFFDTADGAFFFKFHQEEGEEVMAGEYYRADILAKAGLPVDQPVHMSVLPGEQILVYRHRNDPRFSDVLRALDFVDDEPRRAMAVAAEAGLAARLRETYLRTLHEVTPAQVAAEPIHRLFHERLIDHDPERFPGGRLADFYVGKSFEFPGATLGWDEFSKLHFVSNGLRYTHSVGELFDAAEARFRPANLADSGGVTAHGDAHNANVWFTPTEQGAELSFFDPAFAGSHVPALMAEIKATFHNVFAHPFWLYDPDVATELFTAAARVEDGHLVVDSDWQATPARRDLLVVKASEIWRPLLAELKRCDLLPADWRTVIRLGLFLCPTLVMNLRAGARSHTPVSSLIGFSVAVMVGSPPLNGRDVVTDFLDSIDPEFSEA